MSWERLKRVCSLRSSGALLARAGMEQEQEQEQEEQDEEADG
jgi:hypothetical protein